MVVCAVGREDVLVGFGPGRVIGPPAQAARKTANRISFIHRVNFIRDLFPYQPTISPRRTAEEMGQAYPKADWHSAAMSVRGAMPRLRRLRVRWHSGRPITLA